mmetsp:Transcript_26515/g.77995  ORF Transcript_26515/g.77995 Transcript_26515/m.77995 type:complete len:245 (+) Transcript_26515:510-1244(+)
MESSMSPWSRQYLSMNTKGSRPTCPTNASRHACRACHFASGWSCQLWLMKASTWPSWTCSLRRRRAVSGLLLSIASRVTCAMDTARNLLRASCCTAAVSMLPTRDAMIAAAPTASLLLARHACTRCLAPSWRRRTPTPRSSTVQMSRPSQRRSGASEPFAAPTTTRTQKQALADRKRLDSESAMRRRCSRGRTRRSTSRKRCCAKMAHEAVTTDPEMHEDTTKEQSTLIERFVDSDTLQWGANG